MRVFSLEKFVGDTDLLDKQVLDSLEDGWPQELEGKGYECIKDWTMEKEEYDRMYKAMGAVQAVHFCSSCIATMK
jgi:hypothetical protein